MPTTNGSWSSSRCVPPLAGSTPRLTSGTPNVAWVAATRMSVASSSVRPPPRQWPLTAAITGVQTSRPRFSSCERCVSQSWSSAGTSGTKLFRSAPTVNARSPAPVTITARIDVSSRTAVHASDRSE